MSTQQETGYYSADHCKLDDFITITSQQLVAQDAPHCHTIENNVPIYDIAQLHDALADKTKRVALMAEWAHILKHSAGVIVLKNAYADTSAIDEATRLYEKIIADEKAASGAKADHFAAAGNNDRVWNSLQKLCEAAPETFIRYFANVAIDTACEAWLGPNYQMTAQVNLVHPGGQAQLAHRDYHLGFQSAEISATYPAHVHDLSPLLTLQGAIAHCDMPIESGPTKLLPFSQSYRAGYAAWRRDDFRAYFEDHYIQLPLQKGDALFFNPALFHGAGANISVDIHRFANLLQISSAFGRTMETIDRRKMSLLAFPHVKNLWQNGKLTAAERDAAIASTAEGYSFPTNLDRDPPIGGLAPKTQQAVLTEAIIAQWTEAELCEALDALQERQQA